MVDLIGPADAGCLNTVSTTSDVTSPVAGDSWLQDCVGGVAGTGTDIDAKFVNRWLQQNRAAIRFSLPSLMLANAYDYMLSWAIQSGRTGWSGNFGGSANALTGAANNSPQEVEPGTIIRGVCTAANTGATTFNWAGLGSHPVVRIDNTACVGGELVNNYRAVFMWDGTSWVIISPPPLSLLQTIINQYNPFTTMDVGATLIGGNFVSSGGPNPTISVGEVGTCTNPGANQVLFTPTSGGIGSITFFDTRAWGGTVPGNWTITQMGQVGPVYGSGSAIFAITLTRIS